MVRFGYNCKRNDRKTDSYLTDNRQSDDSLVLYTTSLCKKWASFHDIKEQCMIIPGLFEPPVRTLRATIPENESHIFR